MDGLPRDLSLESILLGLLAYGALIVLLFALTKFLPGLHVLGQPLPETKQRRRYKLNGMALFVATHMLVFAGAWFLGLSLTPLLAHFWGLLVAANLITLLWLALMNRASRTRLAKSRNAEGEDEGSSRSALARWWFGLELNPSFLGVDLKVFAYQPSLIGLGLLNLAFAWAQHEQLGHLSPQMLAYQVFWWAYLFTHYWLEDNVLSMWDVIAERFGFMLLWGDLVLVPFFYSIGGWWLLANPEPMALPQLGGVCALFGLGLWMFRGANAQKNRFKRDPNTKIWGKPAKALGERLLISGWWGIGRKLNYSGEIMVYAAFALCTGLGSWIPYLLPLWLCVLLPHRAWRDEQRCAAKYGELWQEYTQIAKFRMVPFLY